MPRVRQLTVNGTRRALNAEGDLPLLGVLRDDLALTGTKYGCGEGQCGACTVLVDGQAMRSCLTPCGSVGAKSVTTIEGLARGETLHPLQEAFLQEEALQCGYCTPGMIMAAAGLLRRNPNPTEAEIRKGLEGNICRCGTYPRIVAAVRRAATAMRSARR
jgi:nicotinate dehydrogenase subunit A